MFVVAIAELRTPLEIEAAALAADHKTTVYEERLNLTAGLPAVVLTTPDIDLARAALGRLRARGHGAIAVDSGVVIASSDMIEARRFRLEERALAAGDPADSHLPWDDLLAILRATHRSQTATETERKQKEFSLGRALATGGLIVSKTTTHTSSSVRPFQEQVVYLFRKSGETPWILRETGTHWGALNLTTIQSSMQSFVTTVGRLRERAPGAVYDERLMMVRKVPERLALAASGNAKSLTVSSESGIDLLAHLVAAWIDAARKK